MNQMKTTCVTLKNKTYLIERSTKMANPSVLKPVRFNFTILYLKYQSIQVESCSTKRQ